MRAGSVRTRCRAARSATGWRSQDGLIKNYQAVVPTTWNASPRDAHGRPGPYEQALVGTPVADPKRPLELLRTVHSFDPCLACAVHVLDTDRGGERTMVTVEAGR
jgi:Ni,Fe-hydrogenase I large subunit